MKSLLSNESSIYRRLWSAVLLQTLRDLSSVSDKLRMDATMFLNHLDFIYICKLLDLNPKEVRKKLSKLARNKLKIKSRK